MGMRKKYDFVAVISVAERTHFPNSSVLLGMYYRGEFFIPDTRLPCSRFVVFTYLTGAFSSALFASMRQLRGLRSLNFISSVKIRLLDHYFHLSMSV